MQYASHIMTVLRNNFDIIMIHRHTVDNMGRFIDDVYACDSYPIKHLRSKTRYLLTTPKEVAFVLVRNNNVNEEMVGKGAFRKPQCQFVQSIKRLLRKLYNPGDKPEHHIIHGTDYESQIHHLLGVFGLKKLSYYLRNEGTQFPYHLEKKPYTVVRVHIEDLMCSIVGTGPIRVKDSPHYRFAMEQEADYREYFDKYWGYQLKEDHWPERFHELLHGLLFNPIIIHGTLILDGLHRASILLSRGNKTIMAHSI